MMSDGALWFIVAGLGGLWLEMDLRALRLRGARAGAGTAVVV